MKDKARKNKPVNKNNMSKIQTLVLASLFLALGLVLPSLTGSIKEIGDSLLPMHLVVMLCGAICGWRYGLLVGAVLPFLRSLLFSMPPLYPNAVWMATELATYGLVIGILYTCIKSNSKWKIFVSLISSMLAGRVVWGISKAILLGVAGKPFGIEAFIIGGFVDAIPGIILQLILVPSIVILIDKGLSRQSTLK
jgi:hypothetical protein